MNKEELKDRTKKFAVRIVNVANSLPIIPAGNVIKYQLIRAGTSVGANYRAACRGRSISEFAAKLGIVVEEADECAFWLEILIDLKIINQQLIVDLIKEAYELVMIFNSSILTINQNKKIK